MHHGVASFLLFFRDIPDEVSRSVNLLTDLSWVNRLADLFGLTHSLSVKLFGQALLNLLFQVINFFFGS